MPKGLNKEKIATLPALQSYLPPHFEDKNRLERIQIVFPAIDKMYRRHAKKNGYPGKSQSPS